MNLEPEGIKVLVLPEAVEEMTAGGLYVPPVAKDAKERENTRGTVIAIGPHAECVFGEGDNPDIMKVGDEIIYPKYGGCLIRHDKIDYRLINEEDVLARIKK